MIITCPPDDEEPWPSLGGFVCDFIEEHLCFGPGDLLGTHVKLNNEQRAWFWRMYEVEPPHIIDRKLQVISKSKNPRAGRRRFQRCALSLRKGSSKTEIAAWLAICELSPYGPVRCEGFTKSRGGVLVPIPRSVDDPYIPMIAYSEEQSEELAYGALRRILQEMPIGNDFDIGLDRVLRKNGKGKAEAVSASPNARDGARTTFQHADETHRFVHDHLKKAWGAMRANLPKRPQADPWALETTTAPAPGEGSVAEDTMEYARAVRMGTEKNEHFYFYHRQASDEHDFSTVDGLKAAVIEASGPYIAAWTDVDRIVAQFREPGADRAYLERVWLNRLVQSGAGAFDVMRWRELKREMQIPAKSLIAIGFDGSRYDDATALIATHLKSGFQWPLGIWERPPNKAPGEWEVPVKEVNATVAAAFARYTVTRMYCDPPKWETYISQWAGLYGDRVVVEWWTNRAKPMAYAVRTFTGDITAGAITHNGDVQFDDHIGNARKAETRVMDDKEKPMWVLRKERHDSPKKIDAAMAAILSWEARNDSIAAGEMVETGPSVYESRGPRVF